MKKWAALIAIALCSQSGHADDWNTADTWREGGFQILNLIDWGQTRNIARNPQRLREVQSAWLIGSHPSVETVDTLMIASAILHPLVSWALPNGAWRNGWQYVTIGGKFNATVANASIGIKIDF